METYIEKLKMDNSTLLLSVIAIIQIIFLGIIVLVFKKKKEVKTMPINKSLAPILIKQEIKQPEALEKEIEPFLSEDITPEQIEEIQELEDFDPKSPILDSEYLDLRDLTENDEGENNVNQKL